MKIFLGSSREALDKLRTVASWIEEAGHDVLAWDDPELFLPGESTFAKLIEIAKMVQASIFIFGEDDHIWYRRDALNQPRDNVLVEYGLFSGALGQRRVIICRVGDSKIPDDAGGITFVSLEKAQRARLSIFAWIRSISKQSDGDEPDTPMVIERAMLKNQLEDARDRLSFEEQKARDLQKLVTGARILDFDTYAGPEGYWKLLFDYNFFWGLVDIIGERIQVPLDFYKYLQRVELDWVAEDVNWNQGGDPGRKPTYAAKALRRIRAASIPRGIGAIESLISSEHSWPGLQLEAAGLADRCKAGMAQRTD
jgi:hypothetical protein